METQSESYHYSVIRRAIEVIDAHGGSGPALEDLAKELTMSPAHLQRVFSSFAGVSPKRYGQYLALGHAKDLLRNHHTTLDTATLTGLSGSSRLHDLFLRWEAMSPGTYATGGEGLVINTGWFPSPFGEALVMGTARGICGIGFAEEMGREATFSDLQSRWPKATYRENPSPLRAWTSAAFGITPGDAQLCLIGAPFQLKVWEALLNIPSGQVTTYSDIARAIGNPQAVRAVGTAVGRNPISWLIPCHRALRKSGGLGGYHWGLPIKRAMLAWETAQA